MKTAAFALCALCALPVFATDLTLTVDDTTLPAIKLTPGLKQKDARDPTKYAALLAVAGRARLDLQITPSEKWKLTFYRVSKASATLCTAQEIDGMGTVLLRDLRCSDGKRLGGPGLLAITKDDTSYQALSRIADPKVPVFGDDLGIALSVIDVDSDQEGFRYLEGASFYYSLSSLKSRRLRLIGNLSSLDFADDVDLETGIGIGLLYRAERAADDDSGSFTISIVRGYNLMVDSGQEGWYNLVGFGWSFGRQGG